VDVACTPQLSYARVQALLRAIRAIDGVESAQLAPVAGAEAVRRVLAGECSFALVHDAGGLDGLDGLDGLACEPLWPGEPLTAYVALTHRLAGGAPLTPAEASRELLALPPRDADPALFDHLGGLFGEAGFAFDEVGQAPGADPDEVLGVVANYGAVTVAPAALRDWAGQVAGVVACVPVEPELRMPGVVLAWSAADPPAQLDAVLGAARSLPTG
jgi:hypothetical protein